MTKNLEIAIEQFVPAGTVDFPGFFSAHPAPAG
jgi:hypothetical protein